MLCGRHFVPQNDMVRSRLLIALREAEIRALEAGEPERWSLARLARVSGLNRGTIQRLIDDPARASVATVEKVAQALGTSFDALITVDPVDKGDQGEQPAE